MHGEVHLGELDRFRVLLSTEDTDLRVGVLLVDSDEVGALHEHAARAARRIEDPPVKGFDYFYDETYDRSRRVKYAALLSFGEGELTEEIFIDLPECVALDIERCEQT